METLIIIPIDWPCTLDECEPGFFVYDKQLCFKDDYGKTYNSAGEYFSIKDSDNPTVSPVGPEWKEL